MRHSTTSKTPITLMFGLPIKDIIQPEVLASINEQDVDDVEDEELIAIREKAPADSLNFSNLPSLLPEDFESDDDVVDIDLSIVEEYNTIRNEARISTQRAADHMVAINMWREDHIQFQLGTRVLIRPDIDSNAQTRSRSLYEHLNIKVYIVDAILYSTK
ncbi:hypothetical protein DMUE_3124 [Dictyocoela muelleri]|nr:hypothetical protein DMUE_3124 [Dictyocoela muelleri]